METIELAQSQLAAAIGMRELDADELDAVSGGDKARAATVLEALLFLQQAELDSIDVEPIPYVPMKL
jgi:hypothetical protein